jgi:hypothetical protein
VTRISSNPCCGQCPPYETCAKDVKKYNIKTLNGKYKKGEYPRLPENRPGQQQTRFDKPRKKEKC